MIINAPVSYVSDFKKSGDILFPTKYDAPNMDSMLI